MHRLIIKHIRKLVVFIIGITIVLIGIILIFTPGPAFIVIPVGLAVLGTEFAWAHHLLKKVKEQSNHHSRKIFDWIKEKLKS
ncbi:MAG: PGPGW domain-containing protein [Deltaproteobacteria bacterium]|nr:PGPGW domain-containing protein [Deltaproteobacteria bacterium]